MTDLSTVYQRVIAAQRPASRGNCPPPEALLAVVEQREIEEDRLRTINHAMTCAACAEELELLRGLRRARGSVVRPPLLAIAAGVLLVLGIGFWRLTSNDESAALRTADQPLGLVAPDGDVAQRPARLVWHAVPNASRYTVELRREDGTLVLRSLASDTTLVLPDSVRLEPRADFYWRVAARLSDGSDVVTAPRRFRIQSP